MQSGRGQTQTTMSKNLNEKKLVTGNSDLF